MSKQEAIKNLQAEAAKLLETAKKSELLSAPFPGASEALWRIRRSGAQIWIVTASVLSFRDIRGWLDWNGLPHDRIIKTGDKRGLGNVLIDDSPLTCQKFYNEGLPVLRYRLAWNKHLNQIPCIEWKGN